MDKKTNQAKRILRELRDKKSVTNVDLNRICYRYGARIYDLRKAGWNILRHYEKPGVYRYTLIPERESTDVT